MTDPLDELPLPSPLALLFLRDTAPCRLCGAWWVTGWEDAEVAAYRAAWTPVTPLVCGVCTRRLAEHAAAVVEEFVRDYLRAVEALATWVTEHAAPALQRMCRALSGWLEQHPGLLAECIAADGPIDADPVPVRREARRRAQCEREPWRRSGRRR